MLSSEASAAWQDVPFCLGDLVPFLLESLGRFGCFFLLDVELPEPFSWLFCALGLHTGFAGGTVFVPGSPVVPRPVTAFAGLRCEEVASPVEDDWFRRSPLVLGW